jgi:hypothetical protein
MRIRRPRRTGCGSRRSGRTPAACTCPSSTPPIRNPRWRRMAFRRCSPARIQAVDTGRGHTGPRRIGDSRDTDCRWSRATRRTRLDRSHPRRSPKHSRPTRGTWLRPGTPEHSPGQQAPSPPAGVPRRPRRWRPSQAARRRGRLRPRGRRGSRRRPRRRPTEGASRCSDRPARARTPRARAGGERRAP